MRKVVKIILITVAALVVGFVVFVVVALIRACIPYNVEEVYDVEIFYGRWSEYDGVKVAFADEEAYNNGDIDKEKVLPELNCLLNEKYYMIVDLQIQADRQNDGLQFVTADINFSPASLVRATIEDADTGMVEEKAEGNDFVVTATYRIPEDTVTVYNKYIIVQIQAEQSGLLDLNLSLSSTGNVQGVKASKIKKFGIMGYTEGLNYESYAGNFRQDIDTVKRYDSTMVKGVKDKNLSKIIIPSMIDGCRVLRIGSCAFEDCAELTNIIIPDSITSIESLAFNNCSKLSDITIPVSVTVIGEEAFSGCTNLIQTENGVHYVDKWVIGCDTNIANLRSSTIGICTEAFGSCRSLLSVTIPDSVVHIGALAFSYCKMLTNVTIPDSVVHIDSYAFFSCEGLTSVSIGSGIAQLSEQLFSNCGSLININYNGTRAEWNNLNKEYRWDDLTGDYTVKCTDGTISK